MRLANNIIHQRNSEADLVAEEFPKFAFFVTKTKSTINFEHLPLFAELVFSRKSSLSICRAQQMLDKAKGVVSLNV